MKITKNNDGTISWNQLIGDRYLVTGIDCSGKRFNISSDNWHYIKCINVWQGTRWLIRNGRRHKIMSVIN